MHACVPVFLENTYQLIGTTGLRSPYIPAPQESGLHTRMQEPLLDQNKDFKNSACYFLKPTRQVWKA